MAKDKIVFVTVGTTEFAGLMNVVLFSEEFMVTLKNQGYTKVTVQVGRGALVPDDNVIKAYAVHGITFDWYRLKPTLLSDLQMADLIISHAGAGTVLEVLRLNNKKLIVVVNNSLQENHQCELADALSGEKYCLATVPESLCDTLKGSTVSFLTLIPFPLVDHTLFPAYLDQML